jgi:cystathionine beta-lyase
MSHSSVPAEMRDARVVPEDLVRLAIGIEDVDDLIDDLRRSLD